MKKTDKPKKAQKSQGRVLKQPKSVTELTDQDLEQVQGGSDDDTTGPSFVKVGPGDDDDDDRRRRRRRDR